MKLIVMLAIRNVWLYRTKSLAIACLLGAGCALTTIGLSLLSDIDDSMEKSIIDSVAGHLQAYSKDAKDELALFGGAFMGREDIGTIDDYSKVEQVIKQHPRVTEVIPMGMDMGILGRGNELDDSFDSIREALKKNNPEDIHEKISQVRKQLELLKVEVAERSKVSADKKEIENYLQAIEKASTDAFWSELQQNPEPSLMFLESKIAPASGEKLPVYLRYAGTDLKKFSHVFKKFKIMSGEMIPEGKRGVLLSYKVREDYLKNVAARLFDQLHKMLIIKKHELKGDAEAERLASDLARQHLQILMHLKPKDHEELSTLFHSLGIKEENGDMTEMVKSFLKVDELNFKERYEAFYKHIAPRIKMYEISEGDSIVLRSYTRSGYIKNLALKVYGVFSFEGIESSDLAGSFNLIDLISFRELYGKMDEASLAELSAIKQASGIKDVAREDIESDLFGDNSLIEKTSEVQKNQTASSEVIAIQKTLASDFDPAEIKKGLALNLAIKLDHSKNLNQVRSELAKLFEDHKLNLQLSSWKEASGIVGQFVSVVKLVLLLSVSIILLVALVIINNTLVIAVINRAKEIGTMRAIGAQKSFVIQLFLTETFLIALLGGLIGLIASLCFFAITSLKGIPAPHEVIEFLFSGPRLYPKWHFDVILLTPFVIQLLATLSSFYTARYAASIKPSEAMQDKE